MLSAPRIEWFIPLFCYFKNSNFFVISKQFCHCILLVAGGDLNFPDANWKTASRSNEEENEIIEIFDEALFRQAIDFPTCSNNTLDVAFYRNCFPFAEKDQSFPRTYDCTDHDAIHLSIECPVTEPKSVLQSIRSFGNADYNGMNKFLKEKPFQLICHTNVNKMCEDFYQYVDKVVETYVPRRTRHRQSLPPWISAFTSNLMKKLKTQKRLLERKPTSYRKAAVMRLENLVTESAEADRKDYQENLMSTRNTDVIFKHLKSLNKPPTLPKQIVSEDKVSTIVHEQVDIMNEFFHSVFSPKQPFSISDIETKNSTLTNFNISVETIHSFVSELDITKSRGPNGLPPAFFKKTSRQISVVLNKLLKVIKKQKRMPDTWKTAAVHKKGNSSYVQNYRPVSLLDIESKILEKCIYVALYDHFASFLTKHQHGFVKNRSVFTNMITFLKKSTTHSITIQTQKLLRSTRTSRKPSIKYLISSY